MDLDMAKKKADQAKNRPKNTELARVGSTRVVAKPSNGRRDVTVVQMAIIQDAARGKTVPELARKYADLICPREPSPKRRLWKARTRIRNFMQTQKFRDILWEETMIGLDLDSPAIVRGISRKAQAGRVDAARLALELNGRHAPHTEVQPTQINVVLGGIPRPQLRANPGEVIDADPEDEVDEIEE